MRIRVLFVLLICSLPLVAQRPAETQIRQWAEEAGQKMQDQDFESARTLFTRIIEATRLQQPDDYQYVYRRAVCWYYLNNMDAALADLDMFRSTMNHAPQPHVLRVFVYRQLGQTRSEINTLNFLMNLPGQGQDEQAQYLRWRAAAYLNVNQYDSARSDLRTAFRSGEDAESNGLLAFIQYRKGEMDSAMVALNHAIELDYEYIPAYRYAASFCQQEGNNELALQYALLGLRVDPTNAGLTFVRGVALVELGRIDEGCSCLNRAFYSGEEDAGYYLDQYCYSDDN